PGPIARPLCHGRAFNPWRAEMCRVRWMDESKAPGIVGSLLPSGVIFDFPNAMAETPEKSRFVLCLHP
ncbi:MAG: hypothetical protein ACP5QG_09415, partial [candidate division WOR-3 bacterium]